MSIFIRGIVGPGQAWIKVHTGIINYQISQDKVHDLKAAILFQCSELCFGYRCFQTYFIIIIIFLAAIRIKFLLKLYRRIKGHHQEKKGPVGEEQEQHNDKSLEESFNSEINERKPVTVNLGFDISSNVRVSVIPSKFSNQCATFFQIAKRNNSFTSYYLDIKAYLCFCRQKG